MISSHRVFVLQFDHQDFIEVQSGFVCVDDLEIQMDHPCDLPSCDKAFFFLRSFFFNKDSSPDVSIDDFIERTCLFRIKNLEVCLQLVHIDRR